MDKETAELMLAEGKSPLEVSIKKWEDMNDGKDLDLIENWTNCGLCIRYFDDDCMECPVRHRTGKRGCHDSPYEDVSTHICTCGLCNTEKNIVCDEAKELIKKELDFLKSLSE